MKHGKAVAPAWVSVIEAASEWARPPWEIAKTPGALVWWFRWQAVKEIKIELQNEANKKNG